MQKAYMPISDTKSESIDLTKRLFRSIADVVRILDDQRQKVHSIQDLYIPTVETQRVKLRDYCERLMFFDPVGCGRRSEELLWRKGYYEVVSATKKLHKGSVWSPLDLSHLQTHLQAGIGHYHHLLLRLQLDFKLDLRGILDFPMFITDNDIKKGKSSSSKDKSTDPKALDWARQAVHRCLIYLGDLARYLHEVSPGYNFALSSRYYHQALSWKPECGMPHNQLGTLVGNNNFFLDAAYHYMRCLASGQSFEGTESNLAGILDKSWKHFESTFTPSLVHHLIFKFLHVVNYCYFDKQPTNTFPELCHEAIDRLTSCQEMLLGLKIFNGEDKNKEPDQLTDTILFKLTVVSIMCTEQLQHKGSDQMPVALAVTLAMMNYLILQAVNELEESLPAPQPPPPPLLNGINKNRRRRRRRRNSSEISSDLSEDEQVSIISSDSDLSEEELVFDVHSSASESEEEAAEEIPVQLDPKKVQIGDTPALAINNTLNHIETLCQNGFKLQTIKVCLDWLVTNVEVLKACGQSATPMLSRTTAFLNHMAQVPLPSTITDVQPDVINNGMLESERIPLEEEKCVRGLLALKPAHQHIDWLQVNSRPLTVRQEAYVRVCKLIQLGKKLAGSKETGITYDPTRKWFELNDAQSPINIEPEPQPKVMVEERGKLLGQLWLKAEVKELETKVRRSSALPPYLVLDCDALIYHIALVKQLVHSKKFITLIPSVVVSSLDEQKRASRRVRDTIRWLESQFRQGNRFLRAQRANEHLSLPLIKYPKKKDKEAWMFFQVAECCYFMSQQNGTRPEKDSLVTLITGSKTLLSPNGNNGFSPLGIAKTAGISIEHIESFHSKWISSSKSHG